jgi:hypothetical protein
VVDVGDERQLIASLFPLTSTPRPYSNSTSYIFFRPIILDPDSLCLSSVLILILIQFSCSYQQTVSPSKSTSTFTPPPFASSNQENVPLQHFSSSSSTYCSSPPFSKNKQNKSAFT